MGWITIFEMSGGDGGGRGRGRGIQYRRIGGGFVMRTLSCVLYFLVLDLGVISSHSPVSSVDDRGKKLAG